MRSRRATTDQADRNVVTDLLRMAKANKVTAYPLAVMRVAAVALERLPPMTGGRLKKIDNFFVDFHVSVRG